MLITFEHHSLHSFIALQCQANPMEQWCLWSRSSRTYQRRLQRWGRYCHWLPRPWRSAPAFLQMPQKRRSSICNGRRQRKSAKVTDETRRATKPLTHQNWSWNIVSNWPSRPFRLSRQQSNSTSLFTRRLGSTSENQPGGTKAKSS